MPSNNPDEVNIQTKNALISYFEKYLISRNNSLTNFFFRNRGLTNKKIALAEGIIEYINNYKGSADDLQTYLFKKWEENKHFSTEAGKFHSNLSRYSDVHNDSPNNSEFGYAIYAAHNMLKTTIEKSNKANSVPAVPASTPANELTDEIKGNLTRSFLKYKTDRGNSITNFLFRNSELTNKKIRIANGIIEEIKMFKGPLKNLVEFLEARQIENQNLSAEHGKWHKNLASQNSNIDPHRKGSEDFNSEFGKVIKEAIEYVEAMEKRSHPQPSAPAMTK